MSAASPAGNGPGGNVATRCATAVLRPEKLKSQPARPSNGRGNRSRAASPLEARRSTAGPPGHGKPSSLPTLSNASPTASSIVLPSSR